LRVIFVKKLLCIYSRENRIKIFSNGVEGKINTICTSIRLHGHFKLGFSRFALFHLKVQCNVKSFSLLPSPSLRLAYNSSTKKYSDAPGVTSRVPGFGNTSSLEYLDPSTTIVSVTQYFHSMVQHFVDKGYTRGKDIVGAPYDWRYSPSELGRWGIGGRRGDEERVDKKIFLKCCKHHGKKMHMHKCSIFSCSYF